MDSGRSAGISCSPTPTVYTLRKANNSNASYCYRGTVIQYTSNKARYESDIIYNDLYNICIILFYYGIYTDPTLLESSKNMVSITCPIGLCPVVDWYNFRVPLFEKLG